MIKCSWTDCEEEGVVHLFGEKFCAKHARMEYAKWLQDENQRHEQTLRDLDEVFTKEMDRAGVPLNPSEDEIANQQR